MSRSNETAERASSARAGEAKWLEAQTRIAAATRWISQAQRWDSSDGFASGFIALCLDQLPPSSVANRCPRSNFRQTPILRNIGLQSHANPTAPASPARRFPAQQLYRPDQAPPAAA